MLGSDKSGVAVRFRITWIYIQGSTSYDVLLFHRNLRGDFNTETIPDAKLLENNTDLMVEHTSKGAHCWIGQKAPNIYLMNNRLKLF